MGESELVDLVCGPASPLPETYQRYRLVARLGSGGQADVYRGVRLCGGVTSAPVTVKVFRIDPRRPLVDELRSWDKGDAALMDLNNRGVPGICRRADGFYGPPPHATGVTPPGHDAVPYQVYDYLHGVNLREYITSRAGLGGVRLNATATLLGLADTLRALHHPEEPGACPVLHMDIKPSNIMVLTNGNTRLIDFTGARYWRRAEITQIAYTPESGGPEALRGEVGPSYDVHGLGAVAFYLVSGGAPRGSSAPPLGRHPIFDGRPTLKDHLLAVLADHPGDRPSTVELTQWVQRLAQIVRAVGVPELGVDWSDARPAGSVDPARVVGRAKAVLAGTETDAFTRIEALERELVALRARMSADTVEGTDQPPRIQDLPTAAGAGGTPIPGGLLPGGGPVAYNSFVPSPAGSPVRAGPTAADTPMLPGPPAAGTPVLPGQPAAGVVMQVGRAAVPQRQTVADPGGYIPDAQAVGPKGARVRGEGRRRLKRGGGWSVTGAIFAFVCWIVWAAANRKQGAYVAPLLFLSTLAVAAFVFIVLRLLGRMILENWMHKVRRGATGAHLGTGVFLIAVGVTYLQQTSWIITAYRWVKGL